MDTISVASGDRWQLLTASLQPTGALNALATAAVLLAAGQDAERRLGSGLFAASFFAAGAASSILVYGASSVALAIFGIEGGGAVYGGAGAALLGPAAALGLAFLPANWGVLSPARRGSCAAAAAALAAVWLTQLDLAPTLSPLDDYLLPWMYGGPALVGALLGWFGGPLLQAQRELDIKEASGGAGLGGGGRARRAAGPSSGGWLVGDATRGQPMPRAHVFLRRRPPPCTRQRARTPALAQRVLCPAPLLAACRAA